MSLLLIPAGDHPASDVLNASHVTRYRLEGLEETGTGYVEAVINGHAVVLTPVTLDRAHAATVLAELTRLVGSRRDGVIDIAALVDRTTPTPQD